MRTAVALLFCFASLAIGADILAVNQPVTRDLSPETAHSYAILLQAGDYVDGSVEQRGTTVDIVVFEPDGARLRKFAGPPDGKRRFAFVAEAAGTYRVELKTAEKATSGAYELKLLEVLPVDERMQPRPRGDRYSSPRIEALRKQIASGETSTEAFWRQATEEHTPMVEPMEKDEAHQLVTFLWRGSKTRSVWVGGSFVKQPQDNTMSRLADSDVWYLTVKLAKGARFFYTLSPNDPLAFDGPRAGQRMATQQADPLNPNHWFDDPDKSRFEYFSMVELPGAVPQPWIASNSNTPAGKVDKSKFKSEMLKNERDIWVYTPPGYSAEGPAYPLIVVFDGSSYTTLAPTPVILDNLIAASKIPAAVAVLIGNPSQATRGKELPPNPDFADFLAKELVPWARSHYKVSSDPRWTVVGGSSYGGIAATYAGLRHSEVFGNILCQSGSFWWAPDHLLGPDTDASTETGWLAKEFIKSPKLPLKFYMDAGLFEVDSNGTGGAILEPSRHMRDVLLAKGYEVTYQQFVGGHDYLSWRGTLADGLIALIGKTGAGAK